MRGISKMELDGISAYLSYDGTNVLWKKQPHKSCVPVGSIAGSMYGSYSYVKLFGKVYPAHGVAWYLHYNEWPCGIIDHENGVPTDNRIDNLRVTTTSGNGKNRKVGYNNKTGIIGVFWNTRMMKWVARITTEGITIHLGYFESLFEAACARRSAEMRHGFHTNHGRR